MRAGERARPCLGSGTGRLVPGCPGWSPAPPGRSLPRYNEINAISTACSYGITACQDLATGYFQEWQQNVTKNP